MRKMTILRALIFALIILTSCNESKSKLNGNVEEVVQMIVSDALMINQDSNNNTHLIYDFGADELDLVEIVIEIEYQYNILIKFMAEVMQDNFLLSSKYSGVKAFKISTLK